MKGSVWCTPTTLIVVLHVLAATILAALLNVWVDEAYALHTTSGSFSYAWSHAIHSEAQPPGYFLFLRVWRTIAGSIFFLRMFSVFCTTVSIILASIISRQYLGKGVPNFVLPLLIATNPMSLGVAVEMRRYALVLMLTCCLLIVFYEAFLRKSDLSRYWRRVYPLLALISLYTDYFIGFLLVAQSILLLKRRDWKGLRIQIGILVLAGVILLPLIINLSSQLGIHKEYEIESMNQLQKTVRYISYSSENIFATIWMKSFHRVAIIIFVIGMAYPFYKAASKVKSIRSNTNLIEPLLMMVVIGLCFVIVSFVSTPSFLRPRHLVVMLVPANLVFVAIAFSLRRSAAIAIVGVVVATNCFAGVNTFGHLAKRGDYRRVARYIESKEIGGEPIIVFIGESAIAFEHEYLGRNTIVPVPAAVDFKTYDLRRFVFRDDQDFWKCLNFAGGQTGGIWVLTDAFTDPEGRGCSMGDIRFNCELFEKVLRENFVEVSNMKFYQARVRYLHRLDK